MAKSLAVIFALLFSVKGNAAVVVEHSGAIYGDAEYNSNLLYLDSDAESVNIFSLIPEYKITASDDRNVWSGLIGLVVERSSDTVISNDREDPFATVEWLRELESGSFGLTAEYRKQSTRLTQFRETGLVSEDSTSVSRSIEAKWNMALSARFELDLGAAYEKTKISGSAQFEDNDVREISARLGYKLNEIVKPFVSVVATDYRAVDRIKFQNFFGGAVIELSPTFIIETGAGIVHVSTTGDNDSAGFFRLIYEGERNTVDLALSRDAQTTDINNVIISEDLDLNYTYELTEKSRSGIKLGLSQTSTDQETKEIYGFYERDFSESWVVRAYMGLNKLETDGGRSANNKTAGISFVYTSAKY